MSKENSQWPNLNVSLKDVVKILTSGGRLTRSKKNPSSKAIEPKGKQKTKSLIKYEGQPCLKRYLMNSNISYSNFILDQYFFNKKMKRLSKHLLPQICIFYEKTYNNTYIAKQVKLMSKKSKQLQFFIEQKQQLCKIPLVRNVSSLESGILTVPQTLVFIVINYQTFQEMFQYFLIDLKKKYRFIKLEELISMHNQQKSENVQVMSSMIEDKPPNEDMMNQGDENKRPYSLQQIRSQEQIINRDINQQQSVEIYQRINKELTQLDQKIFFKLCNINKTILWPALVIQPLNSQREQLQKIVSKYQQNFKEDSKSDRLQAKPEYKLLQFAFDELLQEKIEDISEKSINQQSLSNKVNTLLMQVEKTNHKNVCLHLIGTQTTKIINNGFLKWQQFNQEEINSLIMKSTFRILIDQLNPFIQCLNKFKSQEQSNIEGKYSFFRIAKYQVENGPSQLCIPIRWDQNKQDRKVLIRILQDDCPRQNEIQLLKWVDQNKLKVNLTVPHQTESQKKFYYLLGGFISIQEGLNYIYSDFYYENHSFNHILRKCYPQNEIRRISAFEQRCIYCYYRIDQMACYRCKFCLRFCHQQCSYNRNKNNSDTDSSMVPLDIYDTDNDDEIWICQECSPCTQCQMPVKRSYLKCITCSNLFHQICGKLKGISQNLVAGSKYTCQSCLKCKMCLSKLKNLEYFVQDKSIFCINCFKKYKNDEYCIVCMKEVHGKWVQCDQKQCKKWIHIFCDSYFKQKETKSALDKANYICPSCRHKERRKIFKWVIQELKIFDQYQYFYDPEYQQITGYTEAITTPMCIYQMREKIMQGAYDEKPYQLILQDLQLIVQNALTFNMPKDQPHYRAKILLIVGSKFLASMKDLLQCTEQFIVNENPQQIFYAKRKQFYADIYENYMSYLLNYKSEKTIVEVKRNNFVPNQQQFFSSKIILSNSFANAQFKLRMKKKPYRIENLFHIPRLSSSAWWPIRTRVCYYHPQYQNPIIFYCPECKEGYCCTTRCFNHHICTVCGVKGCGCDSYLCNCPPIKDKEKKALQNRIQLKLQRRQYTEYFKYCTKCVVENMKSNWCYLCKNYCYYAYQKCLQCNKMYHISCQKQNKWQEMAIFYQNKNHFKKSFRNTKLQSICHHCSNSPKYSRQLKEFLQKQTKIKAINLDRINRYLSIFNYIYEQNGIRITAQEITDLMMENYQLFVQKQHFFNDFLKNFTIIIETIGNNKIMRDEFKDHFISQINKKLTNQSSHSHERCVSFIQTKELKELKQSKKFFKIFSKRFNNHYLPVNFINNYQIKSHLEHLTAKINNCTSLHLTKDNNHQYAINDQHIISTNFKEENHFNLKNFQRIRIEIITSYVSPKSKKNIYYTTKIQKFKNYLNFWANYYHYKERQRIESKKKEIEYMIGQDIQNARKKDNQKKQKEYQRYLRFHADHQSLPDCIYKQQSSKSLLFQQKHLDIFNPFQQNNSIVKLSRISNHKMHDTIYINNKSEMLFKYLSNFCLKVFQQNKVVLKKGNTCILSQSKKCWRVLKIYQSGNIQIKLEKKNQNWLLNINQNCTVVKTINDIIRKLSQISPFINNFQDVAQFLGFSMTFSKFYEPNHFTHLLQTCPLDEFNRKQRKKQVLKVYNSYKWLRQGNFSLEKIEQNQTKVYDYNVTKREIFYLKKRNNQMQEQNVIQPNVAPFITFEDIKKDLQDFNSVSKQKDHFAVKQPTNDVYIAPSKIDRLGLFIRNFTKKNTIVTQYIGQIISEAMADIRQQKCHFGCYMFGLTKNNTRLQIIDATFVGNMGRYLNHSCDPNCKARIEIVNGQPRIFIYTIKDVEANQQLTYDYQFKIDTNERLLCKCKAPNCQGRLT